MLLIVALGLLCSLAEGAVMRRQAFFNNSQVPFQQQFQGQYPQFPGQYPQFQGPYPQFQGQHPQFPGQQGQQQGQGQQQPFPQFPVQQPFPGQPPFQPSGFFPQQPGQQQQQQQAQRADVPLPAPVQETGSTPIPIVKLDIQPNLGDGKYQYSYETGNGIQAEEKGEQKAVGEPAEPGTVATGSYSYTDPDGQLVQVTYTADENGFVPQGSHIPTPPPIPPEILAALEKNAAEEAAQNAGAVSPAFHYFFRNAYRHRYY